MSPRICSQLNSLLYDFCPLQEGNPKNRIINFSSCHIYPHTYITYIHTSHPLTHIKPLQGFLLPYPTHKTDHLSHSVSVPVNQVKFITRRMVLSKTASESDVSIHSTFASRYVRTSLPRSVIQHLIIRLRDLFWSDGIYVHKTKTQSSYTSDGLMIGNVTFLQLFVMQVQDAG